MLPQRNTLQPARGRKLSFLRHSRQRHLGNNLHPPQGDGNSSQFSMDSSGDLQNDLHPARGRKHILACPFVNLHLKHFTPRQGTETCLPPSRQKSSGETLYTPQGDGNSFSYLISAASSRNTLSPARGRKHLHKLTVFELISKYFTPRKGRKNDWELLNGN